MPVSQRDTAAWVTESLAAKSICLNPNDLRSSVTFCAHSGRSGIPFLWSLTHNFRLYNLRLFMRERAYLDHGVKITRRCPKGPFIHSPLQGGYLFWHNFEIRCNAMKRRGTLCDGVQHFLRCPSSSPKFGTTRQSKLPRNSVSPGPHSGAGDQTGRFQPAVFFEVAQLYSLKKSSWRLEPSQTDLNRPQDHTEIR